MMNRILFLFLLLTSVASAQQAPTLGYVFPPVVNAGATTNVKLGGYDFTPDMQFFVHREKVKLTPLGEPGEFIIPPPPYWFGERSREAAFLIPREIPAAIQTPANFKPGLVTWQVANANGGSSTAVFYVSNEKEILEQRDRQFPQVLSELPVGISGRLERIAEVDRYQFTPRKNGPVTIDLFARRLGSDFNALIEVRDSNDQLVASVADTQGNDITLTFAAEANATYEIRLHDIDFRGNRAFVYRLAIKKAPRIVATIPAAGQRGKTQEVTIIGYGLADDSAELQRVKRTITFPEETTQSHYTHQFKSDFGSTDFEIRLSDLTEKVVPTTGTTIEIGVGSTGMLQSGGETSFAFEAKKGEHYKVVAQSQAIGGSLDLSLAIHNEAGKQLAFADDIGDSLDPKTVFKSPADGVYKLVLTDNSGRSDSQSVFRLAIEHQPADFTLSAPTLLNLPVGGNATLQLNVERLGGHSEDIALQIEGLPQGVSATGDLVLPAKKNVLKIPLEATTYAATQALLLKIVGSSTTAGAKHEASVDDVLLAVTLPPKFEIKLHDRNRQRAVNRGTTYPAPFTIVRNEGFTGDVVLQMAAKQGRHRQGITAPAITVPGDVSDALFPCFMPEWLETDRTTRMVVLGVAKQRDPAGKLRYITKPADARITMILEGALLKVSHSAKDVTARPGDEFEIPIQVVRSEKLNSSATVEIIPPEPLRAFVHCKPIMLSPEQTEAVLKIRLSRELQPTGRWLFQIMATGRQHDRWPLISQAEFQIEIAPTK